MFGVIVFVILNYMVGSFVCVCCCFHSDKKSKLAEVPAIQKTQAWDGKDAAAPEEAGGMSLEELMAD